MTPKTKYLVICKPSSERGIGPMGYHRFVCAESFKAALQKSLTLKDWLPVDRPYKAFMIVKIKEVYVKAWQNRKTIKAIEAIFDGAQPEDLEEQN